VQHDVKKDARLMESRDKTLRKDQMGGTAYGQKLRLSLYDAQDNGFSDIQRAPY
jgi:hypothetical protein